VWLSEVRVIPGIFEGYSTSKLPDVIETAGFFITAGV